MKHLTVFLLLLVLVALIATSCTDSATSGQIIGTWRWVSSSGGIAGGTWTPESIGHSGRITFSRGGTFTKYEDDRLILSGTYTRGEHSVRIHVNYFWRVGHVNDSGGWEITYVYSFEDFEGNYALQMRMDVVDGSSYTYYREQIAEPDWLL